MLLQKFLAHIFIQDKLSYYTVAKKLSQDMNAHIFNLLLIYVRKNNEASTILSHET